MTPSSTGRNADDINKRLEEASKGDLLTSSWTGA